MISKFGKSKCVKANALLGYALGSPVVPDVALASDDVKITSMELADSSAVLLTVAIEGFDPTDGDAVQTALDAAVSAEGGESLANMSADQVTVKAAVEANTLIVRIVPKGQQSVKGSFFMPMLIRQ